MIKVNLRLYHGVAIPLPPAYVYMAAMLTEGQVLVISGHFYHISEIKWYDNGQGTIYPQLNLSQENNDKTRCIPRVYQKCSTKS